MLLLKTKTRNVGSMRPRGATQSTSVSPTWHGIQEITFLQDEFGFKVIWMSSRKQVKYQSVYEGFGI